MNKLIYAGAAAALAFAFTAVTPAAAVEAGELVHTSTNEIIDSPDNDCPTWTRDTFTRTTTITESGVAGTYDIRFDADGTFDAVLGADVAGTMTGFIEYTVTGTLLSAEKLAELDGKQFDMSDLDCKENPPTQDSSSQWALRFFAPGATATPISAWSYTYETPCESFTEPDDGSVGAKTFSECATPVAPTLTQATCDASAQLMIPEVTGITYDRASGEVGPGSYTVTAAVDQGYLLALDADTEWEFTVDPAPDCTDDDGQDGQDAVVDDGDVNQAANELPDTGSSSLTMLLGLAAAAMIVGGGALIVHRRWALARH